MVVSRRLWQVISTATSTCSTESMGSSVGTGWERYRSLMIADSRAHGSDSSDEELPLVSIITPCLDRAGYIRDVVTSVASQTYGNIEHIIVDGGSTDGTQEILRDLEHRYRFVWISESDTGMYDAINKGLARSKGTILAYLNTDDLYLPWTVEVAVERFHEATTAGLVFGDMMILEEETGGVALSLSGSLDTGTLARSGFLPQPTVFFRRSLFEQIGPFDEALSFVADCDYWLRAVSVSPASKIDEVLAIQRDHPGALRMLQSDALKDELRRVRARYARTSGIDSRLIRALDRSRSFVQRRQHLVRFLKALRRSRRDPAYAGPWSRFLREPGFTLSRPHILAGVIPFAGRSVLFRMGRSTEVVGAPTASGSIHVVVVGQTPPPYGGQAMMIENLLKGPYPGFSLRHVRMNFSRDFQESGRFRPKKIFRLIQVVLSLFWARVTEGGDVLYYPPASNRVGIYRDTIILTATRWLFKTTIFHFHAAGVAEALEQLPTWIKPVARRALCRPTVGIRLANATANDSAGLQAIHDIIIPNAIPELTQLSVAPRVAHRILNVGLQSEPKGSLDLLQAAVLLKARAVTFEVVIVGQFVSSNFESEVRSFVRMHGLADQVFIAGELRGSEKDDVYASASIFCFPSRAPYESFGLVLLEAMQHRNAIVAAAWGAAPEVLDDGKSGLLFPPGDPVQLAERLEELLTNEELVDRLSDASFRRYRSSYTLPRFHNDVSGAFSLAAANLEGRTHGT